jgi:hypothetical protein
MLDFAPLTFAPIETCGTGSLTRLAHRVSCPWFTTRACLADWDAKDDPRERQ